MLLFSLFLIVWGVVLLVWSTQPDEFDLNSTFLVGGIVFLVIGLPLGSVAIWRLRMRMSPHRRARSVA
jgi:hypothetical protein